MTTTQPRRLFASLVLSGAALLPACDRNDPEPTHAPEPSLSPHRVAEPAAPVDSEATPPAAEPETLAEAAAEPACECADQGTAHCSGNGVNCCWANDPCCTPCC